MTGQQGASRIVGRGREYAPNQIAIFASHHTSRNRGRVSPPPQPAYSRLYRLDALRGLAVWAMFVYHFIWDLAYFRFVAPDTTRQLAFVIFGHAIAISFLAIAGFSLALASRDGFNPAAFVRRFAMIAAAAGAVTLATWLAFPQSFVAFGILHCIAAASLIGALFVSAPAVLSLLAGVAMIALPEFFTTPALNQANDFLGLGVRIPLTNDWRPLFPWAGYMLLGLALGKFILIANRAHVLKGAAPQGYFAHALDFSGRHSLALYLLHQPVLFALVALAALMFVPQQWAVRTNFLQACQGNCIKAGSARAYCIRACSCIVRDAQAQDIWRNIVDNRLNATQQARYESIVDACRKP